MFHRSAAASRPRGWMLHARTDLHDPVYGAGPFHRSKQRKDVTGLETGLARILPGRSDGSTGTIPSRCSISVVTSSASPASLARSLEIMKSGRGESVTLTSPPPLFTNTASSAFPPEPPPRESGHADFTAVPSSRASVIPGSIPESCKDSSSVLNAASSFPDLASGQAVGHQRPDAQHLQL